MLLKELGTLLESILAVLAVDALIVELRGARFHLAQHLQHVVGVELAGAN